MSDRLLKTLAAALALLVIAWGVARLVSSRGGGPESAPFGLTAGTEPELDSVVVAGAADTVRLVAGDGWTVNEHEALPDAGESLGQALESAQLGALVSRNPENHERLGVTGAKGRRLTVYAGGETRLSLIIGGRADVFDRSYVRREGDDEVYTLQGSLVNLANRKVDDWRNKEILNANRGDMQRIELAYAEDTVVLVRDSAGWSLEPGSAVAEPGAMEPLLSQLANLRAIGFAADSIADTLSWATPTGRVRVLGPGGAELAELVFLEREEGIGYFVRRGGSPVVYTISAYTGESILKREEDLTGAQEVSG
ncbi:MAG: DUF4340 domain-containing protein [Gemmatimonadota bacterium]|nr:MAG: DUF4340 domain-containing protein [Gemmatimonadota bacterium]